MTDLSEQSQNSDSKQKKTSSNSNECHSVDVLKFMNCLQRSVAEMYQITVHHFCLMESPQPLYDDIGIFEHHAIRNPPATLDSLNI